MSARRRPAAGDGGRPAPGEGEGPVAGEQRLSTSSERERSTGDVHARLVRRFLDEHPGDAARLLETLPAEEAAATLANAEPDDAAGVLHQMGPMEAAWCLARMDAVAAARIVGRMPLDLSAALLRRVDPAARDAVLAATGRSQAAALGRLLRYEEGSAGALMDPKVLALPDELEVGEALDRVRRAPEFVLSYVYVVDREQKLVGVMNLREMMLADPGATLESQMTTGVQAISGRAARTQVLAHPGWRRLHALPVVDEHRVFLGAIRYQTLRRLEEEESGAESGQALKTVVSLGELCWIGMAGMLSGLATTVTPGASDARAAE